MNINIAYILPSLSNKGPIKMVQTLVRELQKEHDIKIFYFKENHGLVFDVPIQKISFFTPIDFDQFDIIHSHGIRSDTYIYFHNKKISRAKSISTLHNYVKEDLKYQYNRLISLIFTPIWNLMVSKHNQVIVLSKNAQQYYQKFWINKSIDYIYNGIDTNYTRVPFHNSTQLDRFKKRFKLLGAIGLLTFLKGFDQIIHALPDLPNHALVVIGTGKEEKQLQALAKQLHVSERVLFLGFEENITACLEIIDILIAPSRSEGFSLVIQEAARQSKPVICSDIPIFRELFSENEIAFFPLENIDLLKQSILKIENDYKNKASHLNQKYLTHYTSRHMAEQYLKYYLKLTSS